MKTLLRIILVIFTIFISRMYLSIFLFRMYRPAESSTISTIALWLLVIGIGVLTWITTGENHRGFLSCIFKGGVIMGAMGFTLGFFGPLIFTPNANLGSLLGILRTGPAGFIVGLIGGAIYWSRTRDRIFSEPID